MLVKPPEGTVHTATLRLTAQAQLHHWRQVMDSSTTCSSEQRLGSRDGGHLRTSPLCYVDAGSVDALHLSVSRSGPGVAPRWTRVSLDRWHRWQCSCPRSGAAQGLLLQGLCVLALENVLPASRERAGASWAWGGLSPAAERPLARAVTGNPTATARGQGKARWP